VIERIVFVPVVCLALAATGVFPHLLVLLVIADWTLAVGGWVVCVDLTAPRRARSSSLNSRVSASMNSR
jgi:hypothetical protein